MRVGTPVRVERLTTEVVSHVRHLVGREGTVAPSDVVGFVTVDFGDTRRLFLPQELALVEEAAR